MMNERVQGGIAETLTLTDYQCVSTGCCTHVAKTEITIDNQHVTKSLQRYRFLPKQSKENTEKTQDDAKFNMPKGILCIFTIILVLQLISRFYGRASLGYCQ